MMPADLESLHRGDRTMMHRVQFIGRPILGVALVLLGVAAACSSPTNPRLPQPDSEDTGNNPDRGDESGFLMPSGVEITFLV